MQCTSWPLCTPHILQYVVLGACIMFAGAVSLELITGAYDLNNLILMTARVPQIMKNFSNKSTGQLSIITYAANTAGCIARIFTTMQEGGGSAMLRSYCISEWPTAAGLAKGGISPDRDRNSSLHKLIDHQPQDMCSES